MLTAMHRDTRKVLDAEGYEKAYGKPVDAQGNEVVRPYALCEVCEQDVFLRAAHSDKRTPNFSHFKDGPYCPTKSFNAESYRKLQPVAENPEDAIALRAAFFATWKSHWVEFDRLVHYATIYDFCAVLAYADKHNLWAYRGMRVQDALPALLTLMDFGPLPKEKSHLRDYGIRFFYKGSVANTSEYWNLPSHTRKLMMVKYNFPGRTRSFQEDNIASKLAVTFDQEYLTGKYPEAPYVHPYPISVMVQKFRGSALP